MIAPQVMSSHLAQVNNVLATAYNKEFKNNRLQDDLWMKVHNISLHCLTTGIMILEGAGDAKYSRLPQEELTQLKNLASNKPHELPAYAATIMSKLRNNPAAFAPQFKVVVLLGPLDDYRFIWKKALRNYTLDESGFPTNPQDICDVIFREYQNYGVTAQVLVREKTPEVAQRKALAFLEEGQNSISKYNEKIKQLLDEMKLSAAGEEMTKVDIEVPKVWAFKIAVLNDPDFREYIEDVHIKSPTANKFGAQILSQLIQMI